MKSPISVIQKFLKSFNEDPRGWGVLLVLLIALIGERYYHVHNKHHVAIAKPSVEKTSIVDQTVLAPQAVATPEPVIEGSK